MTDRITFYIEVLESRLRFLNREIAKVARFDESFNALSEERDDVEHELEGLCDDICAAAKAIKQIGDGR